MVSRNVEPYDTPLTEVILALNALMIVTLSAILLGAFGLEIFAHEYPCPLCYLQRIGMIGVALGAMLNICIGLRPAHYGLSLGSALFGAGVALRQIALHICPGSPAFGVPL